MHHRRALAFILCTVTLDVLALGIMVEVLPEIVLGFTGGKTASAAELLGLFATIWGLMQFLCSPLMGALSDRLGRRPVLLISCLGLGIDYVFMAVAPSLTWLFVGRFISGITSSSISISRAYVADITPVDGRAKAFGLVGMAFGLGFTLGPAIGGLLGEFGPRVPFWASAAACGLNAVFGWFVLPESLPPERRVKFVWKRANPVGSVRFLLTHPQLPGLATVLFITALVQQVLPAVFVLYASYRFAWTEQTVGYMLALVGVSGALVQGLLIGPAVKLLGLHHTLVVGLACGVLGMTIYALAPTGQWLWLGVPIMALSGIATPALQDLMSRRVGESQQGELQGANNVWRSFAGLIGPGLFSGIFAAVIGWLPGAPFLVAAFLFLVAVAVAWAITVAARRDSPS